MEKVWHQARLGVLSLNKFLFSINRSETENCIHCKVPEDLHHILDVFPLYDNIWKEIMGHIPRLSNNNIKSSISENLRYSFKRKAIQLIASCLKKRKILIKSKNKKTMK